MMELHDDSTTEGLIKISTNILYYDFTQYFEAIFSNIVMMYFHILTLKVWVLVKGNTIQSIHKGREFYTAFIVIV